MPNMTTSFTPLCCADCGAVLPQQATAIFQHDENVSCPFCLNTFTLSDLLDANDSSEMETKNEMYSETFRKDDVEYILAVRESSAGFWGKWHCCTCESDGANTQRCNSQEEAFDAVKSNLNMHHSMQHDHH